MPKKEELPNPAAQQADNTFHQASVETIESKFEIDPQVLNRKAVETISAAGYEIDEATAPYKLFGSRNRFFIRKCRDSENNEVVVKIAAPDSSSVGDVEKETMTISIVQNALERARSAGKQLTIHFPEKVGEIRAGEMRGLVTRFIQDDKVAKQHLSADDRVHMLRRIITDIQQLDVPDEILRQQGPHWEQQIPVKTGEVHVNQIVYALEGMLSEILTPEESGEIRDIFAQYKALIDTFPLRFSHCDMHAENIMYELTPESSSRITLIDLEALCVDNEFSDWAMLATLSEVAPKFGGYDEEVADFVEEIKRIGLDKDSAKLGAAIEREVIIPHPRGKDAKIVYLLMCIESCLDKFTDVSKKTDRISQILSEVYVELLRERVRKIRELS